MQPRFTDYCLYRSTTEGGRTWASFGSWPNSRRASRCRSKSQHLMHGSQYLAIIIRSSEDECRRCRKAPSGPMAGEARLRGVRDDVLGSLSSPAAGLLRAGSFARRVARDHSRRPRVDYRHCQPTAVRIHHEFQSTDVAAVLLARTRHRFQLVVADRKLTGRTAPRHSGADIRAGTNRRASSATAAAGPR
jgi:hypothetical protein